MGHTSFDTLGQPAIFNEFLKWYEDRQNPGSTAFVAHSGTSLVDLIHSTSLGSWVILVLPRCNSLFQVSLMYLVYRESCQLRKHIHSSFPSSVSQRASSSFALVHSDIWEPNPIKSNLGFKYLVTLIENYSRCTRVFLMKTILTCFLYFKYFKMKLKINFEFPSNFAQ